MAKRNTGTGKPDPTKDRSAHEAARGRKKVSLQDLANELPSQDELNKYIGYVLDESDRGAAIMAAALTERALEDKIRSRLVDPGDGTADSWFVGINAPFRTFSAKISLGRALGIYDQEWEDRLITIKNVRNAFAHRMIPLDFKHPTIVEECKHLPPDHRKGKEPDTRRTFSLACLALAGALGMKSIGGPEIDLKAID